MTSVFGGSKPCIELLDVTTRVFYILHDTSRQTFMELVVALFNHGSNSRVYDYLPS